MIRAAWLALAAVAATLALAGPAAAQPRVAVTGDDPAVVAAVRDAIAARVTLVEVDEPGAAPPALAQAHLLAAVVVVDVRGRPRGRRTASVAALQGSDGAELARFEVSARGGALVRQVGKLAWKRLGKALLAARAPEPPPPEPPPPPPEPPPAPAPEAAPVPELALAAPARPAPTPSTPARLEVSAEGSTFLRTLSYNDDLAQTERAYDLAAPAVQLAVLWRPRPVGLARLLSVRGAVELAVGVGGSRTPDGREFATSSSEWSLAVRGELPAGRARLRLEAGYGEHRFTLDDDPMDELVPDATYRWLRAALGGTHPLTPRVALDVAAGWRHLLTTGDLASAGWFPRATGAGVDLAAGARWRLAGPLAVQLRAELRRYFFAMNPEPGDPRIVGGAVDQVVSVSAGLTLALR